MMLTLSKIHGISKICIMSANCRYKDNLKLSTLTESKKLDGSLPANPVNDRHVANAVTLKITFLSTVKSAIIQKYLIMERTSRNVESKYLSVKYPLIS